MTHSTLTKITGWALGALLFWGCGGKPLVAVSDEPGGQGSTLPTAGSPGYTVGDAGTGGGTPNGICKKECSPGECGPIADGCGSFIECGGCTLPEVCGGAGVPSHCGKPADVCVPKTCAELSMDCGLQGDGCGGIVNCWGGDLDASTGACADPTMQCVKGHCQAVTPICTPKTCADYATAVDLCGPVSDGCGSTIDCGFKCSSDKVCGLNEPGKCDKVVCVPESCESALIRKPSGYCGAVEDGCGGIIADCGATCTGVDVCGGGGVPNVCGHGTQCVPHADCTGRCGPVSDGCTGTVDCGGCTAPEVCGGGGEPGECGAPVCVPKTCAQLNAKCGSIADGCGTMLQCGSCTLPETCGGGGTPYECGSATCIPKTAQQVCQAGMCGPQSDGCSGSVDCGGCTAPNTCGGGGTPSVCGAPQCTKLTCADYGANCGPVSDGCGGFTDSCGTCASDEICGAVAPSVCGKATNPNCTGLCPAIDWSCPANEDTRLSGKVYAPNGVQPLNNALVYVPNSALPGITSGPSCDRCADEPLGNPIAGTVTGPDGSFVLHNVPAGVDFPLVVKVGKWRRVVTIPAVTRCTNVNLTVEQTRLPRNMQDATQQNVGHVNIPHFAIATGQVDAIECVLRQIGVSDSEFTLPSGTGRIHMYRDNGGTMGCKKFRTGSTKRCASTSSSDVIQAPLSELFAVQDGVPKLNQYDVAIFDCRGSEKYYGATYDAILHDWANAGGRLFASHYSYTYLYENDDFADTATWGGPQKGNGDVTTGIIDKSFARGQAFNTWLGHVGAWSPSDGFIEITDPREYVKSVNPGTDRFIYTDTSVHVDGGHDNATNAIEQYAFNTPFGADPTNICGRVLYSSFHVAGASSLGDDVFPTYCSTGEMTAQEKVLEYMIFDLSSCVTVGTAPPPVVCTPRKCSDVGANCGPIADGCGGLINCGDCTAPETCGGGGTPNVCGNYCTRTTCGAVGANCGIIADGCGGTLDCGDCTAPAVCGGGGTPNICGSPACTPRSCADAGAECGAVSDGCGGTISCGSCEAPMVCGGGGTPNVCGLGSCSPGTCGTAQCGFVGDGCGGTIACGTCPPDRTCVGGVCVGSSCKKLTCAEANAGCGFIGDGCGGVLDCGDCTLPQVCGGGGVPSQCGGSCTPRTCTDAQATCGAISDGCGGILQCGSCPPGLTCGGGGVRNQWGAGTCSPETCMALDAECGSIGNGCGGVLECGPCPPGLTCGGAGVPNKCGAGGCTPLTCQQQNANCGPVADGCGGLMDCGNCPPGQTCGGGGVPSQCGSSGPILT